MSRMSKRIPGESLMARQSPTKLTSTTLAQPIHFTEYTTKFGGYLTMAAEDHALFRYATIASNIWKNHYDRERTRELEGQAVQQINARQIFANVARWYDVEPGNMAKRWGIIDKQFFLLKWPRIPLGFGLRQGDAFDTEAIIHPTGGNLM